MSFPSEGGNASEGGHISEDSTTTTELATTEIQNDESISLSSAPEEGCDPTSVRSSLYENNRWGRRRLPVWNRLHWGLADERLCRDEGGFWGVKKSWTVFRRVSEEATREGGDGRRSCTLECGLCQRIANLG